MPHTSSADQGRKPHDRNPETPQAGLACEGERCIYHNPSEHHMSSWPIARGGERCCPHGVGHPDPDYLAWRVRVTDGATSAGVHGCDGCCVPPADQPDQPGEGTHVCDAGNFDRTVCPEPCGYMHSFCSQCDARQDPCAHENA